MHKLLTQYPIWTYGAAGLVLGALIGAPVYAGISYVRGSTTREELAVSRKAVSELREKLGSVEEERDQLQELLRKASDENAAFGKRVEELASNVNFLDKMSKTDRELLQKYSSVYFLSENFIPDPLVPINEEMLARSGSNMMIHGSVFPFLEKMMAAAERDGFSLRILSSYRSFGTQSSLKSGYKITYGAGTANKFSADQGYSEHQLGTTVDFTTAENPTTLSTSFRDTPHYSWLIRHAHEYGFVLSYPEGNSFFQFEPWHWRFVGVDLATRLYYDNMYFYDLDQREINAYLARIFD
ncbi:D-alanyl-D-alanine carboxypeptidase family protein [bacterium]|nr:D-alanyl-D-alanine carboxypeptidase family protein [bacterium]